MDKKIYLQDPKVLEAISQDPLIQEDQEDRLRRDIDRLIECFLTGAALTVMEYLLSPAQMRDVTAQVLNDGLNQRDLAAVVNVSQAALNKNLKRGWNELESGEVNVRVVIKAGQYVQELPLFEFLNSRPFRETVFPPIAESL